ncbi:helix-turn-helix domain-containing protein [Paenibacillus puerhi]|uniref:helix-turn-helix domain-containing protein n=1 Tax=Paenibacillus puerhi TaxID=2692622 RepID=UPI00135CB3D1|nr:AraC family transcriptional regulator [Paenibacillus puerhi]
MNPVQKTFDASSSFPFACVYRDTKQQQAELPDHIHDWCELVYVYSGKGTFFIDQSFYEMSAGDLFLIPGHTIHRAFPDQDDPVTSTAIFFSPQLVTHHFPGNPFSYLTGFEQARKDRRYKCEQLPLAPAALETVLDDIQDELVTGEYGNRQAILLLLQRLLLAIVRSCRKSDPASRRLPQQETLIGPSWMKEILHDLDAKLSDSKLGLSVLADRASVSPAHFCRTFKQLTGLNVTEYLTMKRMFRAKELLLQTDANISDIAPMCGFDSLPHFHRMFKKIVGETPAVYRRSHAAAQGVGDLTGK